MSAQKSKKNIIILTSVALLILLSLILKFDKYILKKDFFVYLYAPCDIDTQVCFQYEEELYTKMYQKAYIVEQCIDDSCDMYACSEDEQASNLCMIVQCSEDSLEEGEICITNQEV